MKYIAWFSLALGVIWASAPEAQAAYFELSGGFSYSSNDYGNGNYAWNRHWTGSLGYHLSELSEIELSFQDIFDRTKIVGFEDTTFHDQILSVDWVQSLLGRNAFIQPYVKIGVGQLNRTASGTYTGGLAPPSELDQVTIILGGGLKLFITREFALRAEATSYLPKGNIQSYKSNLSTTFGVSIFF